MHKLTPLISLRSAQHYISVAGQEYHILATIPRATETVFVTKKARQASLTVFILPHSEMQGNPRGPFNMEADMFVDIPMKPGTAVTEAHA